MKNIWLIHIEKKEKKFIVKTMNLKRDQNRIPTIGLMLNTDGSTIVQMAVNPSNHAIKIDDGDTGNDYPFVNAERDDNRVPVAWGVSSSDLTKPIPIYGDLNGLLQIKST